MPVQRMKKYVFAPPFLFFLLPSVVLGARGVEFIQVFEGNVCFKGSMFFKTLRYRTIQNLTQDHGNFNVGPRNFYNRIMGTLI